MTKDSLGETNNKNLLKPVLESGPSNADNLGNLVQIKKWFGTLISSSALALVSVASLIARGRKTVERSTSDSTKNNATKRVKSI